MTGMTVADLMPGASPPAAPVEEEDSMLPPEQTEGEDEAQHETMKILAEEFRSAPVEDAVDALSQMVRMLIRKYK